MQPFRVRHEGVEVLYLPGCTRNETLYRLDPL